MAYKKKYTITAADYVPPVPPEPWQDEFYLGDGQYVVCKKNWLWNYSKRQKRWSVYSIYADNHVNKLKATAKIISQDLI